MLLHQLIPLKALLLTNYEDILPSKLIYTLVATTSIYANYFENASKALGKLEVCEDVTNKDQFSSLAVSIFTKCSPNNPKSSYLRCYACSSVISEG